MSVIVHGNHKKHAAPIIATLLVCSYMLAGCAKEAVPDVHAISIDSDGNTGLGIHDGSTYDEWADAYSDYFIQIKNGDGFEPYIFIEDEAADTDGIYMVSAFYVDDVPISVEELIELTEVSADELADTLSSAEYLSEHTVVYRYIIFTIEDGVIADMNSDYLNYNLEL